MKLAAAGELFLLEKLRRGFKTKGRDLVLGIGDDCAVIKPAASNMLLTTDMMVEGVHFDMRWTTPFQLGFKLVSVNVSDIYSMGGLPRFLLLDFAANSAFDMDSFRRFFDGVRSAMKKYGVSLIGGDISASDKLVVSATVAGYASRPITRNGARPGDCIYVTGHPGDSSCGLRLLKRIKRRIEIEKKKKEEASCDRLPWTVALPLLQRHLMPVAVKPDVYTAKASSMIDLSDGLLIDLSRICRGSHAGAKVYTGMIPLSEELRLAAAYLKTDPLEFALSGGEDYELLFTAPRGNYRGATCIGEITAKGMFLVDADGRSSKITPRGYQHFAKE